MAKALMDRGSAEGHAARLIKVYVEKRMWRVVRWMIRYFFMHMI